MDFLFGKSKLKPAEVIKGIKEGVNQLASAKDKKDSAKLLEEVSKNIGYLKQSLLQPGGIGSDANELQQPQVQALIADMSSVINAIYQDELISSLVIHLQVLPTEVKKDVSTIVCCLLRRQSNGRSLCVEHFQKLPQITDLLVKGHEGSDTGLHCGVMLKECVHSEALIKQIHKNETFTILFKCVDNPSFDISSNAFATLKEIFANHKPILAEFMEKNYDQFFEAYTALLHSENYVTKRQSLKLLSEILLDRVNFNIMTKYIAQTSNLKLMMNLLRDSHKSIQYEAFHVFKVFVANPNKTQDVLGILTTNKEKLIKFFSKFQDFRDDEQFNDEKAYILKQLDTL